jgi:hypothetical protein
MSKTLRLHIGHKKDGVGYPIALVRYGEKGMYRLKIGAIELLLFGNRRDNRIDINFRQNWTIKLFGFNYKALWLCHKQ